MVCVQLDPAVRAWADLDSDTGVGAFSVGSCRREGVRVCDPIRVASFVCNVIVYRLLAFYVVRKVVRDVVRYEWGA